jgi:hypothetical protein
MSTRVRRALSSWTEVVQEQVRCVIFVSSFEDLRDSALAHARTFFISCASVVFRRVVSNCHDRRGRRRACSALGSGRQSGGGVDDGHTWPLRSIPRAVSLGLERIRTGPGTVLYPTSCSRRMDAGADAAALGHSRWCFKDGIGTRDDGPRRTSGAASEPSASTLRTIPHPERVPGKAQGRTDRPASAPALSAKW